jgi:hypothetical protein
MERRMVSTTHLRRYSMGSRKRRDMNPKYCITLELQSLFLKGKENKKLKYLR